jgi:hypothetical protein
MPKLALAIESDGPGKWKLVAGPSEDVASVIAHAKGESVKRGGGEASMLVLSTNGIEKRYKIGPVVAKAKVKS